MQLGAALDLFDFEAAAEVAGSKFYYMRRAGAGHASCVIGEPAMYVGCQHLQCVQHQL